MAALAGMWTIALLVRDTPLIEPTAGLLGPSLLAYCNAKFGIGQDAWALSHGIRYALVSIPIQRHPKVGTEHWDNRRALVPKTLVLLETLLTILLFCTSSCQD